MGTPTNNTTRLEELLKQNQGEFNVLKEALTEVNKEDAETRKGKAKEMIRKAIELRRQMDDAEKQFNSQKKKWDKDLGKVLQRLNNMAQNKPLDEGVEKEEGEKTDDSE